MPYYLDRLNTVSRGSPIQVERIRETVARRSGGSREPGGAVSGTWAESGTGTILTRGGSFGLWFGDATNSTRRSWWNGFSRLESRRGANAVVRESGRLPSIRAGFAGYSMPANWLERVNQTVDAQELEALRRSVQRGRPFGQPEWQRELESCPTANWGRLAMADGPRITPPL